MQKIISFLKKHFYGVAGVSLAIAMVLFFVPEHALGFFSISSIVTGVIQLVAYVLNYLIGLLLMLATFFATTMLNLNLEILDTSKNQFIAVGWKICRDIANLGFVLALVISALVTIVRSDSSFTVKKNLPKIVTAAILVNFSLSIAGVLMNLSDTFTYYFINHTTSGGSDQWATMITGAFGPQRLLLQSDPLPPDPKSQGDAVSGFAAATLISISGLVFSVLFTALATLIMGAIALMLLYRYVVLTFLLAVVPLAWLFYVFPGVGSSGNIYKKWWDNFIKWTFFAPAMMFFVYLSVLTAKALENTNMEGINNSGLSGVLQNVFGQGVQMITLGGLLVGSLLAGQAMGMSTAKTAMGIATKTGNKMKGWAAGKAANAGRRVLTAGSNQDAEGRGFVQRGLGGLSTGLRKIPLLGGLAAAGTVAASRGISGQKEKLAEQGRKMGAKDKALPNETLLEQIRNLETRGKGSVKEEARLATLKEELMKRDGIDIKEKESALTGISKEDIEKRNKIQKEIKDAEEAKLKTEEEARKAKEGEKYKPLSQKELEQEVQKRAGEAFKKNEFLQSLNEKQGKMDKRIINQFKAAGNIDTLLKYRPEFAEEVGRAKDGFMMKEVLERADSFLFSNTEKLGEILAKKGDGYDKIATSSKVLEKIDSMKTRNNSASLREIISNRITNNLNEKVKGIGISNKQDIQDIMSILGKDGDILKTNDKNEITGGFDKFMFQAKETYDMLQKRASSVRILDKNLAKQLDEKAETLRVSMRQIENQMDDSTRRAYDAQKDVYTKHTMFAIDHKEDNKNFINNARKMAMSYTPQENAGEKRGGISTNISDSAFKEELNKRKS